MEGIRMLEAVARMCQTQCVGCDKGGVTLCCIPEYIATVRAEEEARQAELEALRYQVAELLQRLDPQVSLELVEEG